MAQAFSRACAPLFSRKVALQSRGINSQTMRLFKRIYRAAFRLPESLSWRNSRRFARVVGALLALALMGHAATAAAQQKAGLPAAVPSASIYFELLERYADLRRLVTGRCGGVGVGGLIDVVVARQRHAHRHHWDT